MLTVLSLFHFSSLALGAPTSYPTPTFNTTDQIDGVRYVTNYRSTAEIVWTCLVTTCLCTWVSMHPDILGYRYRGRDRVRVRVLMFLVAFMAPEVTLLFAAAQWKIAHDIVCKFGHRTALERRLRNDAWNFVENLLGAETANKLMGPRKEKANAGSKWRMVHSHFLLMGGVIFEIQGRLEYLDLAKLLRVSERGPTEGMDQRETRKYRSARRALVKDLPSQHHPDIRDRSKADVITKTLTFLQTIWFIVQLAVRRVQNIDVTALEVITLAYAITTLFIYIFWKDKPLHVQNPIVIVIKVDDEPPANDKRSDSDPSNQPRNRESLVLSKSPSQHPDGQGTAWVRHEGAYLGGVGAVMGLVKLVKPTLQKQTSDLGAAESAQAANRGALLRAMDGICSRTKMLLGVIFTLAKNARKLLKTHFNKRYPDSEVKPDSRVYLAILGYEFVPLALAFLGVPGSIYYIAWNFTFPKAVGQILWRISCVVGTSIPIFFTGSAVLLVVLGTIAGLVLGTILHLLAKLGPPNLLGLPALSTQAQSTVVAVWLAQTAPESAGPSPKADANGASRDSGAPVSEEQRSVHWTKKVGSAAFLVCLGLAAFLVLGPILFWRRKLREWWQKLRGTYAPARARSNWQRLIRKAIKLNQAQAEEHAVEHAEEQAQAREQEEEKEKEQEEHVQRKAEHWLKRLGRVLKGIVPVFIFVCIWMCYFGARLILVSLALWSLYDLPPDAHQTVAWARFVPHF